MECQTSEYVRNHVNWWGSLRRKFASSTMLAGFVWGDRKTDNIGNVTIKQFDFTYFNNKKGGIMVV
jgi:hypothetical protein